MLDLPIEEQPWFHGNISRRDIINMFDCKQAHLARKQSGSNSFDFLLTRSRNTKLFHFVLLRHDDLPQSIRHEKRAKTH